MTDLKPCPFCGLQITPFEMRWQDENGIAHASNFYFSDRCYGGTDYEYRSEEEAVEAWNRRANDG